MRRFYPLPADEPSLWPDADNFSNKPGTYHLGRRTLDSGLNVTWGQDPEYWSQINDLTSPRGRVWRLNQVCWLAVNGKVLAPRPGLYAAFFRVRQANRRNPLLRFSAEWKASAKHPADVGFVHRERRALARPPSIRQKTKGEASWTHWGNYHEQNPGGWLLCHVGNIVVGEPAGHAAAQRDGGGADEEGETGDRGQGSAAEVLVSFGGENDWCGNLDVDFAAIAPIRLSWNIVRVLMIGHRKGDPRLATGPGASGAETRQRHAEEEPFQGDDGRADLPSAAATAAPAAAAQEDGIASPLSRLPDGVLLLVLEFSQPTLVRPRVGNEQEGEGKDPGAEANEDDNSSDVGAWEVF